TELAHAAYVRLTASEFVTPQDWLTRLETAKRAADFADAFTAFEVLRRTAPGFETQMVDETVSVLEQGFGTLGPAAQLSWEEYLSERNWRPYDPSFSPDVIGMHYALHLAENGDARRAREVALKIEEPDVLEVMAADRR